MEDSSWAVTSDALVAGIHFLANDPADLVARKALRCNLSDLAAMGAVPRAYTLSLALPRDLADAETWLTAFTSGLAHDQKEFDISLIGGDSVSTTGPVWMSITAFGTVPAYKALRRSSAAPGEDVWVSGTIGDGTLGLNVALGQMADVGDADVLLDRYRLPRPRATLGPALVGHATSALDISDGLVQDAGHIARQSKVTLTLDAPNIPVSDAAKYVLDQDPGLMHRVLTGGDDYEILFTAPTATQDVIREIGLDCDVPLTRIGRVSEPSDDGPAVIVLDRHGQPLDDLGEGGWRHA